MGKRPDRLIVPPPAVELGSFARPTPVSFRVDAILEDGQSVKLWGYFKVEPYREISPPPPFWLAPQITLEKLSPVPAELVSAPDDARSFALLQVGQVDPKAFVTSLSKPGPLTPDRDSGYEILRQGMKVGALPYGDRTYKIAKLPQALSGLTLLRTRMGHKAVLDGRFSIVVSLDKPGYVLVALDERALESYKQNGSPGWLQEFAPTGLKLETDDPAMAAAQIGYRLFARRVPAGRVVLGPPCMDVSLNAMYFALFAEAE
jgi:hypothetical protein